MRVYIFALIFTVGLLTPGQNLGDSKSVILKTGGVIPANYSSNLGMSLICEHNLPINPSIQLNISTGFSKVNTGFNNTSRFFISSKIKIPLASEGYSTFYFESGPILYNLSYKNDGRKFFGGFDLDIGYYIHPQNWESTFFDISVGWYDIFIKTSELSEFKILFGVGFIL